MPLKDLLRNNKAWAAQTEEDSPGFFESLAKQQTPEYLWIGCSDSRVPANQIVDLAPGEVFVHRNIANQVNPTDFNCLSVVQYAVEHLKVKHIIVCGHYGCGGVAAAMEQNHIGLIDNWISGIRDTYFIKREYMESVSDHEDRINMLCEFNVKTQVTNLAHTKILQKAWQTGQELHLHGWIYSIKDGIIKDLDITVSGMDDVDEMYRLHL